jgi:hypothetical protein
MIWHFWKAEYFSKGAGQTTQFLIIGKMICPTGRGIPDSVVPGREQSERTPKVELICTNAKQARTSGSARAARRPE